MADHPRILDRRCLDPSGGRPDVRADGGPRLLADHFGAGATSYLWAAILAVNFRWLHVDPVVYTLALNVVFYLGAGHTILAMALRGDPSRPRLLGAAQAVVVTGLAMLGGNFVWFAYSGMEATLVVFLAALAALLITRPASASHTRDAIAAGIVTALLGVTRPEAMVFGPLLAWASHRLGHKRRDVVLFLAFWSLAPLVYFGANAYAVGTPFPATLGGRKWLWLADSAALPRAYVEWDFACAWIMRLRDYTLGTSSNVALWISFVVAGLGFVQLIRERRWGLVLVAIASALHLALYGLLLPTLGHGGRYQPLLPFTYLFLVGAGSIALLESIGRLVARFAGRQLPTPARWVALLAGLAPWIGLVATGLRDWRHDYAKSVAHIRSTEIGLGALVDRLPPEAKVASFDIGGIGFASHRPIVDLGGLCDPSTVPMLIDGTIAQYLRAQDIGYIVLAEDYDRDFPGVLNFGLRLHLRDNPALRLTLVHALETPQNIWVPAILATSGSAPRQSIYKVEYVDRPAPARRASPAEPPVGLDDPGHHLGFLARTLVEKELQTLANAGIRTRLSVDVPAGAESADAVPDDAWWVRLGNGVVDVEVPRTATTVTAAEASALMSERLGGYLAVWDYAGGARMATHALVGDRPSLGGSRRRSDARLRADAERPSHRLRSRRAGVRARRSLGHSGGRDRTRPGDDALEAPSHRCACGRGPSEERAGRCDLMGFSWRRSRRAPSRGARATSRTRFRTESDAVRAALESSADPNRLDANGDAAIHLATRMGQTETIRILLEHHASVDILNKWGATSLTIAVDSGCLPCAYELLAGGADPNFRHDKRDEFMIHKATRSGSPELVTALLKGGADPNVHRTDGQTPLHVVAAADVYRSPIVARLLLEHGADLHAVDSRGDTPLHTAAVYNQAHLIAYFASVGADLNAINAWGSTALDRAVERHQDLAAEELYALGADARTTAPFEPPLVAAARTDDVERARTLLIFGADPQQPFKGESAVDVARKSRSNAVLALLTSPIAHR